MMRIALVASVLITLSWAISPKEEEQGYRRIPGGFLAHKSCMTEVSAGTILDEDDYNQQELSSEGNHHGTCHFPVLNANMSPNLQIYASDVHQKAPDGKSFSILTADFVVPPLPLKGKGQTVYFWPGFKSKAPEMGYPVIQPVLQYGEPGLAEHKWQLQSWFVDANSFW